MKLILVAGAIFGVVYGDLLVDHPSEQAEDQPILGNVSVIIGTVVYPGIIASNGLGVLTLPVWGGESG
jgi:hypothetical protein